MSKPKIRIMTLNVGRFLQSRTRGYLERLTSKKEVPDVLCLQDMPKRDLAFLQGAWPYTAFEPMTIHLINGERAEVGIAILSKYSLRNMVRKTTWGDGTLKELQGVNDKNERTGPDADELVLKTEDRVAICATVVVVDDGRQAGLFHLATTHGFWVRGGIVTDNQCKSTLRLIAFLEEESRKRDGLLLAGDLNFARGSEMYEYFQSPSLTCGGFTDCVPKEVKTTLDPDHPASRRGIKVVSDYFFDANRHDRCHSLVSFQMISGVSDHCALIGEFEKDFGL